MFTIFPLLCQMHFAIHEWCWINQLFKIWLTNVWHLRVYVIGIFYSLLLWPLSFGYHDIVFYLVSKPTVFLHKGFLKKCSVSATLSAPYHVIKTDTVTNILMIPITSNEISLRPVLAISRHNVVITTGFICIRLSIHSFLNYNSNLSAYKAKTTLKQPVNPGTDLVYIPGFCVRA